MLCFFMSAEPREYIEDFAWKAYAEKKRARRPCPPASSPQSSLASFSLCSAPLLPDCDAHHRFDDEEKKEKGK